MRNYEVFEREFTTKDEYIEFVEDKGIYKWNAYCGAFNNTKYTEDSGVSKLTVRIPHSNCHSHKVRYLTEMGFQKTGLIKQ